MSDLSITQMFMETVQEQERGVVNGVQSSMNKLMNMVKDGLVTALPLGPQFGLLVILSFSFIAFGAVLQTIYTCRTKHGTFTSGTYRKIDGEDEV